MRVDWQRIVLNIQASQTKRGAMAKVSRECGMCNEWLRNFKRGNHNTPNFDAGVRLLRIHLRLCGREKHREVIKK